jgi:hypothetical protein
LSIPAVGQDALGAAQVGGGDRLPVGRWLPGAALFGWSPGCRRMQLTADQIVLQAALVGMTDTLHNDHLGGLFIEIDLLVREGIPVALLQ